VGTWGPGAFDNDDALDLLDSLAGYDEAQRRQAVESIFRRAKERLEDLSEFPRPGEVVAAAALVAAGLESGEAIGAEIIEQGYETALLSPESNSVLACDALAALLVAAGRDGEWHQGWVNAETATQARQTTNRLVSIFNQHEHQHDRELPLDR
jgi:hypothetical protein